jgi:hypothetical protein
VTTGIRYGLLWVFLVGVLVAQPVVAQDGLAASLSVLAAGVEVQRVGTSNWVAVEVESLVGTGDGIRTNETGTALITFFADGTDVELLPGTEYRINEFRGNDESFQLDISLVIGETLQRIGRLLGDTSSYTVETPVVTLGARGTVFAVRVLDSGQSGALTREGTVAASEGESEAEVPAGFGVRGEVNGTLSDVVRATTFDELFAALDGCAVAVTFEQDDVSYNVRIAPNPDAPIVSVLDFRETTRVFGVTETTGWYRVAVRGGFGWIRSGVIEIEDSCAGLRLFPDDLASEDVSRYTEPAPSFSLEDLLPTATPGP